jgi:DNA-directed RNA polymerase sigma subunit (sigma70/sigma32)
MNKKICEILDIELNIMLEKISSLDAAINLSEDNKYSLYDALPTCETQGVEYKINIDDTNDAVKSALMNLTEKERLLIMSQF